MLIILKEEIPLEKLASRWVGSTSVCSAVLILIILIFYSVSTNVSPCLCAIKDTNEHNRHDPSQSLRNLTCTGRGRQLTLGEISNAWMKGLVGEI